MHCYAIVREVGQSRYATFRVTTHSEVVSSHGDLCKVPTLTTIVYVVRNVVDAFRGLRIELSCQNTVGQLCPFLLHDDSSHSESIFECNLEPLGVWIIIAEAHKHRLNITPV